MIIEGQLEIDVERGVIYFHAAEGPLKDCSLLRISGLPTPIKTDGLIDINASTPGIVALQLFSPGLTFLSRLEYSQNSSYGNVSYKLFDGVGGAILNQVSNAQPELCSLG